MLKVWWLQVCERPAEGYKIHASQGTIMRQSRVEWSLGFIAQVRSIRKGSHYGAASHKHIGCSSALVQIFF